MNASTPLLKTRHFVVLNITMQEVVTKTNFVVTVCKNYVAIFAVCSFFRCVPQETSVWQL